MTAPGYDIGAAVFALVLAPRAARRLRKAGVWTFVMGWTVGLAAVFWRVSFGRASAAPTSRWRGGRRGRGGRA